MTDKDRAKEKCNNILTELLGVDSNTWWESPNKAFDLKTPNEIWDSKYWGLVYSYLLDQLSGDYFE